MNLSLLLRDVRVCLKYKVTIYCVLSDIKKIILLLNIRDILLEYHELFSVASQI